MCQTFEGEPIRDNSFLLLINAHHEPLQFVLPGQQTVEWQLLLDTASVDWFLPGAAKLCFRAMKWKFQSAPP